MEDVETPFPIVPVRTAPTTLLCIRNGGIQDINRDGGPTGNADTVFRFQMEHGRNVILTVINLVVTIQTFNYIQDAPPGSLSVSVPNV